MEITIEPACYCTTCDGGGFTELGEKVRNCHQCKGSGLPTCSTCEAPIEFYDALTVTVDGYSAECCACADCIGVSVMACIKDSALRAEAHRQANEDYTRARGVTRG